MGKKNKKKNRNKNRNNRNNNHGNNNQSNHESNNQVNGNQHVNEKPHTSHEEIVHFAEQIEQPQSSKKTIFTFVIVVLLALFLTMMILFSTGLLKKEKIKFLPLFGDDAWLSNKITENENTNVQIPESDEELVEKLNSGSDDKRESTETPTYTRVMLPMLLGDNYDIDVEAEKLGCDYVWWVTRYVPYTKAPLNATYKELFSFDQELDFHTGNYAANQSNLSFDKATIENRVAKVYLTGSVDPIVGECDADRLENQLTRAATRFGTVDSAVIYLNGELY
jgi:hypothetical protein